MDWKSKLADLYEQHMLLTLGAVVSLSVLIVFLILQQNEAKLLSLDVKWILVSFLPLLIVLLAGGYIKSFKGFGVELEAGLKNPVSSVSLIATDAAEQLPGDEKRSLNYLHALLDQQGPKMPRVSRLIFIIGRQNYYSADVVSQYLRALRTIKYIEVRKPRGEFMALIPVSVFKRNNEVDTNKVAELIQCLEAKTVFPLYEANAIRRHVSVSADLLNALQLMRKENLDRIAVLSDEKEFVGLLTARDIERRIADEVLAAKQRST